MKKSVRMALLLMVITVANNACAQIRLIKARYYFTTGKSLPGANDMQRVDSLVNILKDYDVLKLTLTGFADSIGSSAANMRLSQKRVETMRSIFLEKGVNPKIVQLKGNGEEAPTYDNSDEAGRNKNRRVELVVAYQPVADNKDTAATDTFLIGRKNRNTAQPVKNIYCWLPPDTFCSRIEIKLPQGTILSLCNSDYARYKDCLRAVEWGSDNTLPLNPKMRRPLKGNLWARGLTLTFCDTTCPVMGLQILIPIATGGKGATPGAYSLTQGLSWKKMGRPEKVKRADTLYYVFNQRCYGMLMCCTGALAAKDTIKIKNRSGVVIDSVVMEIPGYGFAAQQFKPVKQKLFKGAVQLFFTGPQLRVVTGGVPHTISLSRLKGRGWLTKPPKGKDRNENDHRFYYHKKYIIKKKDLA